MSLSIDYSFGNLNAESQTARKLVLEEVLNSICCPRSMRKDAENKIKLKESFIIFRLFRVLRGQIFFFKRKT